MCRRLVSTSMVFVWRGLYHLTALLLYNLPPKGVENKKRLKHLFTERGSDGISKGLRGTHGHHQNLRPDFVELQSHRQIPPQSSLRPGRSDDCGGIRSEEHTSE